MSKKKVAADSPADSVSGSAAAAAAKPTAPTFEETQASTKSELGSQPKVRLMVPLEQGEPAGTQLPVEINGYKYFVPKGHWVDVPQSVAEVIQESLKLPTSALDLSSASADKKSVLGA